MLRRDLATCRHLVEAFGPILVRESGEAGEGVEPDDLARIVGRREQQGGADQRPATEHAELAHVSRQSA